MNCLSPSNAASTIPPYLSFIRSKPSTYLPGSFAVSGSVTKDLPSAETCSNTISLTNFKPLGTRLNSLYTNLRSVTLSPTSIDDSPDPGIESVCRIGPVSSSSSHRATAVFTVLAFMYSSTLACSSASRDSTLRRYWAQSLSARNVCASAR